MTPDEAFARTPGPAELRSSRPRRSERSDCPFCSPQLAIAEQRDGRQIGSSVTVTPRSITFRDWAGRPRAASVDQAVHALGTSSWILVTDGPGTVTFIDGRHTLRGGRSTSEMPNPMPRCHTSRKVTFARRLRDPQPLLDFGAVRDHRDWKGSRVNNPHVWRENCWVTAGQSRSTGKVAGNPQQRRIREAGISG